MSVEQRDWIIDNRPDDESWWRKTLLVATLIQPIVREITHLESRFVVVAEPVYVINSLQDLYSSCKLPKLPREAETVIIEEEEKEPENDYRVVGLSSQSVKRFAVLFFFQMDSLEIWYLKN